MAFDMNDKPWSESQITKSTYDPVNNAVMVNVVAGGVQQLGTVQKLTYDYSVPVTTAAYTEILSATSEDIKQLDIFDSSGQLLVLAFGELGAEEDKMYITPGGNGQIVCAIPTGTRLSIKAVSDDANAGYLAINLMV